MTYRISMKVEIMENMATPSIVWPATLPAKFQEQGFSYMPRSNAVRSEVDAGPAYQRPRYSTRVEEFTGAIVTSDAQLQIFLTFYHGTLGGGALAFAHTHPITGTEGVAMRFIVSEEPTIVPIG